MEMKSNSLKYINSDSITVVTVTCGRRELLSRAARSVYVQDYPGCVEHLIIADDCLQKIEGIEKEFPPSDRRSIHVKGVMRPENELGEQALHRQSAYPRLARLLNKGVLLASSKWLAFLDDDNEFDADHLSRLYTFAADRHCQAVHSARAILNADGSPYLAPFFPGASTPEEGARIYRIMCDRGVWVEGTNILKDRADRHQTSFTNSTVISNVDPVFLVDQNLWLISRELLMRYPIPENFSDIEITSNTCPDDKMLQNLILNNVEIKSNNHPSVRYYLGGISNGVPRL